MGGSIKPDWLQCSTIGVRCCGGHVGGGGGVLRKGGLLSTEYLPHPPQLTCYSHPQKCTPPHTRARAAESWPCTAVPAEGALSPPPNPRRATNGPGA